MSLGEDSQEGDHVRTITMNNSMALSFSESSPPYGEQTNNITSSLNILGVNPSLVLPPPPPAVFLGYTLPPGHPCNGFNLPPPPADKKRTGPRRKYHFGFLAVPKQLIHYNQLVYN